MSNVDERVLKQLENLSEGAQEALVACAGAFPFGCNWGFIRPNDATEMRRKVETLRSEADQVRFTRLKNAILVECNPDFLVENVNKIVPNIAGMSFKKMAADRKNTEAEKFARLITRFVEGKDVGAVNSTTVRNAKELTVGLYCINEVNKIRLKGKDYNAFKLNFREALIVINELAKKSNELKKVVEKLHFIQLGEDKKYGWVSVAGMSARADSLYAAMELADSNTGVFVTMGLPQ